jgi:hypothetical protein
MRARLVEDINFERGQDPKIVIGRWKMHEIELPSGHDMEGPYSNKKQAEKLLKELENEIEEAQVECEMEGIWDDQQMDILDDIVKEYTPRFKELGYEYTEGGP